MKRILLSLVLCTYLMPMLAGVVELSFTGGVRDLDYQYHAATGVYTIFPSLPPCGFP